MKRLPGWNARHLSLLLFSLVLVSTVARHASAQCGDTSVNCLAGRIDNFATTDGAEPTAPSPALQSAMVAGCGGPSAVIGLFDVEPVDQCLGHSFVGCWAVDCAAGATLTMHVKGGSGSSDTDDLILGEDANPIYAISFNALQAWRTGGGDMTWDSGDEATFVLELGNLPTGTLGPTDIRSSLQDGDLDILLSDDTIVDYIKLDVRINSTPALASTWGQVKSIYR